MFGDLGDDVVASALSASGQRGTADGEGVGLGTTAGEDDLGVGSAEQSCDLTASLGDRGAWLSGVRMTAGRVAEVAGEVRERRLDDVRIDGRGRVVVEVDRPVGEARVSHLLLLGWVSYMRSATTSPEKAVRAATVQMAAGILQRSAIAPASNAPTANPPSRHRR